MQLFVKHTLLLTAVLLLPANASAVNTIFFSPTGAGEDKSVPVWGVDTAWPNFDNVRQSIEHIGQANVEAVRVLVYLDEPLVPVGRGRFDLTAAAKQKIDNHLALAAMAGDNIPITFGIGGSAGNEIDPDYVSGSGINVTNYVTVIKETQEYINSRPGFTSSPIYAIEPFNEPDFDFPNANPADLNSIITQLKTYSEFQNTLLLAPSVLNSDLAQGWYDQVPQATAGSSHLLAGSLTSWTNFIEYVNNDGKPFINPEIHSMGEILAGAERGMEMGMVWADVLRGRGTLIQASDGQRLGYAENFGSQSAGAVYRAPSGDLYAFAGGLERDYTGGPDSYRFVSDQDVYFNGIRVREFMLQTKTDESVSNEDNDFQNFGSWSSEGAFAEITLDDSGVPPLDGRRWKIVSEHDGTVMEVFGSGVSDGALIRSAVDDGGLNQLWNITRTRNGYYHLYNANSGRTAEVAGGNTLSNGQDVRQWGTADNQLQQWYVEEAGDGTFYIRNAYSNLYLDAELSGGNIFQWESTGGANQKWRFVPANPTYGPTGLYSLAGNTIDSAGGNHGQALGGPAYVTGPDGQPSGAMDFDGVNDYILLPTGAISSPDITLSAWVRWDGGDDWQRIFDFGQDTNSYMFLTPSSGDGNMRFAITESSNGGEQVLETSPLPIGEWVHLAVTLGGNTGVLYMNGSPQVAGQILLNPTDIPTNNNYLGRSQWPDPLFNGAISDFRIYDYALTPEQVAALVPIEDGDFNGDGFVDTADFTIWRDSLGMTGLTPYELGDANGDGAVTASDYEVWRSQFGQSAAPSHGTALVGLSPEPCTAWLLSAIACLAGATRPRRAAS